jgi:hypothetical protein
MKGWGPVIIAEKARNEHITFRENLLKMSNWKTVKETGV